MNRKYLLTSVIIVLLAITKTFAQSTDPVLLQVAGEKITKNEFLKVFNKNNINTEGDNAAALQEYLDLYINFRLKVAEAKALGMDTARAFVEELDGYRSQLAAPYLEDKDMSDRIIKEAYERKLSDVHAAHILVKTDRLAPAADTLAAWNKIIKLRKRLAKGEPFAKVAAESSDDPSAKDRVIEGHKVKGNHGDLGYFTVFDMVYPFESAVYNAKPDEISAPLRTDYGYHLVKLIDKTPALGKIQLAHIMLVYPEKGTLDDSLKVADSANMAYRQLQNGVDFGEVAKLFSDDLSTSGKGGLLPWFGVTRLLPEFVANIKKLNKVGDYTEPFQTQYGWHIVKLADQRPVGTFEEEKEELNQRVPRSDRAAEIAGSFIRKNKAEYGFTESLPALNEVAATVTDSIFKANWKAEAAQGLTKALFTIGTRTLTQADFVKYLAAGQQIENKADIQAYVRQKYNQFVDKSVYKYADDQLDKKYPDFKELLAEYHDGILLFDLTDKKVWSKAVTDSVGLQQYYDKNKNNYLWDTRLDASVYTVQDPSILKSLKKLMKKKTAENLVLAKFNHDSIQKLTIDHKLFLKGDSEIVDKVAWKPGTVEVPAVSPAVKTFVVVHKVVAPEPKPLEEIRGLITADYQNFLEKQWIAELRAKYPVILNKEVFQSVLHN